MSTKKRIKLLGVSIRSIDYTVRQMCSEVSDITEAANTKYEGISQRMMAIETRIVNLSKCVEDLSDMVSTYVEKRVEESFVPFLTDIRYKELKQLTEVALKVVEDSGVSHYEMLLDRIITDSVVNIVSHAASDFYMDDVIKEIVLWRDDNIKKRKLQQIDEACEGEAS